MGSLFLPNHSFAKSKRTLFWNWAITWRDKFTNLSFGAEQRGVSVLPHWMFRNAFCWPKCPVQCSALKYVHPKVITVIVIYLGTFVLRTSCRLNVRRSFAWPPAASTVLSWVCLSTISVSIRIANCLFVVVKAALVLSIHCHWLAFIEMLLIFNLFCWI